jgi:FkbM family methyltransferase
VSELFEHFLRVGDELGVTTRLDFVADETLPMVGPPLPHEAFEWMAVLDAIAEATEKLTMVEVGAGFGRWSVRAGAAARRYRPDLRYHLVAVEAEPTHFDWLRLHLEDNGFGNSSSRGTCHLVNAAVSGQAGEEDFYVGDAAAWYGQALVRSENVGAAAAVEPVNTVRLSDLLQPLDRVDLIDMDIQGAELEVLTEAAASLKRVRRIHVETHSAAIDERLPRVFREAAGEWCLIAAAPLGARQATPLGEADFGAGGVQLWHNTGLTAPAAGLRSRPVSRGN